MSSKTTLTGGFCCPIPAEKVDRVKNQFVKGSIGGDHEFFQVWQLEREYEPSNCSLAAGEGIKKTRSVNQIVGY